MHLLQAEKAFNSRKFKDAILFFEMALKDNKTPEVQYYYGVSLLQISEYQKAEVVFNELKASSPIYKDKSLWNLAIMKLKQKDYKAVSYTHLTLPTNREV